MRPVGRTLRTILLGAAILCGGALPSGIADAQSRAHRMEGTAQWYGTRFDGRVTASGERFDRTAMTTAHPTLPFGTKVRVTNVENGKSVVVTVNDRCRCRPNLVADLSEAAARELDFIAKGKAPVRLEIVN
jgi:rare lipoprotein A